MQGSNNVFPYLEPFLHPIFQSRTRREPISRVTAAQDTVAPVSQNNTGKSRNTLLTPTVSFTVEQRATLQENLHFRRGSIRYFVPPGPVIVAREPADTHLSGYS